MYPTSWPRCPLCGQPVMDGRATCGIVTCDTAAAYYAELEAEYDRRRDAAEADAASLWEEEST